MKRKLLFIVCLALMLTGCGANTEKTNSVKVDLSIEKPEGSKLNSDEISSIPDLAGFYEVLQSVAGEMDAGTVDKLTYLSCEKMDDGTSCKFSFKYKSGEAYAYFAYDKEKWIPIWVIDAKDSTVYWVGEGMEEHLPLMAH